MEAVDFRIWKKGKLPAKQQLLILLLAGILLVVVVSPVPDQKDPEIGTGAGQEETETEGGEATEQQYERLLEKGWKIPWNAWRESGK